MVDEKPPLTGRVAVITGASGGIGLITAHSLAQAGATVVVLARRLERLTALCQTVLEAGGQALAIETDVMNLNTLERAAREVENRFGTIDILIHGAGILTMSLLAEKDPQSWGILAEKNLLGTFYTTHAFLPLLLAARGDMVTISSICGENNSNESITMHNSTRFGLVGWSDALRLDMAKQGVRVIVVEPGRNTIELSNGDLPFVPPSNSIVTSDSLSPLARVLDPGYIASNILYSLAQPKHFSQKGIKTKSLS